MTIGYVRCALKSDSQIESQVAKIRQYCEYMGYGDCTIIMDNGVSGNTLERDGLELLFELVTARPNINRIVVVSLSALSRSMAAYDKMVTLFGQAGVSIVFIE